MKAIGRDQLQALRDSARGHARGRLNCNLHEEANDPVQRLLIAMHPGSYVRAHQHPDQWELLMASRGSFTLLTFDDAGQVSSRQRLSAQADQPGSLLLAELPAGTWHTLLCDEPDSLFFEVKPGPYVPSRTRYADWAPAEGAPEVAAMLAFLVHCEPGDQAGR